MRALLTVTFGGRGTKDKFTWISFLTKGSTFALFNQRAALRPQKDYIEQVPLIMGASLRNAPPKHLLWEERSWRWDTKLGLGHLGTLLLMWLKEGVRDLDCRATSSYPPLAPQSHQTRGSSGGICICTGLRGTVSAYSLQWGTPAPCFPRRCNEGWRLPSRSKSKPTSRVKAIGWSCHQARMDLCPGCLFAGFRAECLRNRVFEINKRRMLRFCSLVFPSYCFNQIFDLSGTIWTRPIYKWKKSGNRRLAVPVLVNTSLISAHLEDSIQPALCN